MQTKSWRADIYKTGPPNKRGSVLINMCSMEKNVLSAHWQARMKFDFPLGSAVPTRVMEYVSLSLLKDYCPKGMAVSHAPMCIGCIIILCQNINYVLHVLVPEAIIHLIMMQTGMDYNQVC